MDARTARWRNLFKKNCARWDDAEKRRYLSIPNDQEEIDEEELQSCIELIEEINKKPPIE